MEGASELRANSWSVPVVFDWNSDGKKDLLVGNRYIDEKRKSYGYVNFYENVGTDAAPSFSTHTLIQTCTDKCLPLNVTAFG